MRVKHVGLQEIGEGRKTTVKYCWYNSIVFFKFEIRKQTCFLT